ncbi:MAG: hypothetical protein DLM50_06280 [Candidatus Meridianibacter frigidus]|nr:MAG: hypothetical protein DLM50_06280 [Candidatus Eremiobacteraeota bacterium]
MPQAFNYGNRADAKSMLVWYRGHLPHYGWHVQQERINYPGPGDRSIIGTRSGQAVTIVIDTTRYGCRVSVIKLNASK